MQLLYSLDRDPEAGPKEILNRYDRSVDLAYESLLFNLYLFIQIIHQPVVDKDTRQGKLRPGPDDLIRNAKLYENVLVQSLVQNKALRAYCDEHKGLYWSKIKGTEDAKTIEPDEEYIIPLGKARTVITADDDKIKSSESMVIITYGMGVYWSKNAAKNFEGKIEIIDLRTLYPLDEVAIFDAVKKHHRALIVTEEPYNNSFAQALCGRIQQHCFQYLDARVMVIGSENLPAIPLNTTLEFTMIPNTEKVGVMIEKLLAY